MTQFLVTTDDDQFLLTRTHDLASMITAEVPFGIPNRPQPGSVTVETLTPAIVAELAAETGTILSWRVKHKGVTIAALSEMPTQQQVHALCDGDSLTDITIHFETEAI